MQRFLHCPIEAEKQWPTFGNLFKLEQYFIFSHSSFIGAGAYFQVWNFTVRTIY